MYRDRTAAVSGGKIKNSMQQKKLKDESDLSQNLKILISTMIIDYMVQSF